MKQILTLPVPYETAQGAEIKEGVSCDILANIIKFPTTVNTHVH
jgi:hypothetical protein